MAQWRCFKCKLDMVNETVELDFSGLRGWVKGLECPNCKARYILEDVVIDRVLKAEQDESAK